MMLNNIADVDLDCIWRTHINEGLSVSQKVQEIRKLLEIPDEYDKDLERIFTNPLPIVKALEVVTHYQEKERVHIQIYQQPEKMDSEVQEALGHILSYSKKGCGSITYEQWNCGDVTEFGKAMLQKYQEENHITGIPVVYSKVLRGYECEVVRNEGSSSYIKELTGIVIG
ncbi:MAG: hypothetical protein K2M91_15110 [Lachnospiraceae bacterium]|nr:hypothetical protein [Lachnospiraceae bacterium]